MAIKLGNTSLNSFLSNQPQASGRSWFADILVGDSKLYCVTSNMNTIYVFSKNTDGTPGAFLYTRNWYSQDSTINEIHRNGSSVPSAYAVYVQDGKDYLVGWSHDSNRIILWSIDQNSSVSRVAIYSGQERTFASYSRGGWDGLDFVYFRDTGTRRVFRWNIKTKQTAEYVVTTQSNSWNMDSSYTGSGLTVDNDYIYWGNGANENDYSVGCFRLDNGNAVDGIEASRFNSAANLPNSPGNLPTHMGVQFSALHPDICYVHSTSISGFYIIKIQSAYGALTKFSKDLSFASEFTQGAEYYGSDLVPLSWTKLEIPDNEKERVSSTVSASSVGIGVNEYQEGYLQVAEIDKTKLITGILTV